MKRENSECHDVRSDCKGLKSYCETHREKLEGACDYTCGYCSKSSPFSLKTRMDPWPSS